MSIPIYLDNNLFEIKKFHVKDIFGKKIILFENFYDIDYLLSDMYKINNNINGVIVDSPINYIHQDYLRNFEKVNYTNANKMFEHVINNHNNIDSVFVLRLNNVKNINFEDFIKEYIGTFIFIYADHFFNRLITYNIYSQFDLVLIYNSNSFILCRRRFFDKIESDTMCDLIKHLKKNGLKEFYNSIGTYTNIIFDTKCENMWYQDMYKYDFQKEEIIIKEKIPKYI